jgi:phosphoribosylformimino-5-aminoimidazole carboxamide ribotide isomerase
MEVIPAIDLLGDDAVRLRRGDYDQVVFRDRPLALARRFGAAGVDLVHVVDLDGARNGGVRPAVVRGVAEAAAPARIQASGGIRSVRDALALLEAGAARVVVGTAAFDGRDALGAYVDALGQRLVVALDVRDGAVAVEGWARTGVLGLDAAIEHCVEAGVARLLCTAIERDGTLGGPDLDLVRRVVNRSSLPVLAAGGVRSEADLDALAEGGAEAAIVGRAVVDGAISPGGSSPPAPGGSPRPLAVSGGLSPPESPGFPRPLVVSGGLSPPESPRLS